MCQKYVEECGEMRDEKMEMEGVPMMNEDKELDEGHANKIEDIVIVYETN